MAEAIKFKKVKVNHSGSCGGFSYIAGEEVKLSEDILSAIGKNNYEEVADTKQSAKPKAQPTKPKEDPKEDPKTDEVQEEK